MEIYKKDIISLAEKLIPGTLVITPIGKGKLLEKYPFIAMTDKGCWKWVDIYLAEHGVRE